MSATTGLLSSTQHDPDNLSTAVIQSLPDGIPIPNVGRSRVPEQTATSQNVSHAMAAAASVQALNTSTAPAPSSNLAAAQPSTTGNAAPALVASPQHMRRRQHRPNKVILSLVLSLFKEWWLWEILAGLFSTSCLVCICILLASYDGRPIPDFRWGITLNAVVALLTTMMKGALLTLLTEGTSQLKWLAFAGPQKRQLSELDVYDAASRGGFGSVLLLWRHKRWFWRDICFLAAIFTIASIGIDTFTQQLIQSKPIPVPVSSSNSVVARNTRYADWLAAMSGTADGGVPYRIGPDMTAALYSGLYGTNIATTDLSRCSSANCSYPITPSVAICSKCNNVTDHLVTSIDANDYTVVSLPNGPQVYYGPESTSLINSTSTSNASATITMRDVMSLITEFRYINVSDLGTRAEAMECGLYICAQAYNTTVENGIMHQEVVRTWTEVVDDYVPRIEDWTSLLDKLPNGYTYVDLLNLESKIADLEISVPQDALYNSIGGSFNVSAGALWGFSQSLPYYFQGDCGWDYLDADSGSRSPPLCSSDIISRIYYASDNTAALMNLIATSMTSSIRRSAAYTRSSGYAGTVDTLVLVVVIQWSWIVLPAIVTLFANIFLVHAIRRTTTISKHSEVGVWKSSQMPMLYHGLDSDALAALQAAGNNTFISVESMQDHAETMRVSFVKDADSLKLSTM